MPDFRVAWNLSTETGREQIVTRVWVDPPHEGLPGRLNPEPSRQPRYARCAVGVEQSVMATLPGAPDTIPNDVDLGGRLFSAAFLEAPGVPPTITGFAGASSFQSFTPTVAGHYTLLFSRELGGAYILHLEVEAE